MLVGDLVLFREQCIAIFSLRSTRRRQFSHVTHVVKININKKAKNPLNAEVQKRRDCVDLDISFVVVSIRP